MRSWGVEQKRREFTEFYAAAKDDCMRIVLISVGNRQLAEDLVAEAFTRAWMSWRTVRDHPAPRAWVVRTALNAHVSWWRHRRREVPRPHRLQQRRLRDHRPVAVDCREPGRCAGHQFR